jgi:hypothetical protein
LSIESGSRFLAGVAIELVSSAAGGLVLLAHPPNSIALRLAGNWCLTERRGARQTNNASKKKAT